MTGRHALLCNPFHPRISNYKTSNMKQIIFVLGLALLMTGCDRNRSVAEYKSGTASMNDKPEEKKADPESNYFAAVTDSTTPLPGIGNAINTDMKKQPVAAPQPQPDWDKKIIKNGTLGLEVKDFRKFSTSLREKIRSAGGYVAQEAQEQNEYRIGNNMTIKVPVDQFDAAMQQFSADVLKVTEQKVSTEDVTRQYIDNKTRMDAKKAVLQRYTELLKQAKTMEDILNVQNEINSIQEEMEAAGGEAEYLKHASAFSTITVNYFEILDPAAAGLADKPEGNRLISAFRSGWNGIAAVCIELMSIWPVLIAIVAALMILRKRRTHKAVTVS